MSVLIQGMQVPTRCAECWLMDGEDSWCTACRGRHLYPEYRYGIKDRPEWCPLVSVPPHGRLIDETWLNMQIRTAKEIHENEKHDFCNAFDSNGHICTEWWCVEDMIENAPTIIPAEEAE